MDVEDNEKSILAENQMKSWTVLIYANGNNDLEPEIRQAVQGIEGVGSIEDVNVVIQLGRADYAIVKTMRKVAPPKAGEIWSGVRRYIVSNGKPALVANLGKINMADPRRLYEFIKWGMQSLPAERYILILGGHGYQFVGSMPDYSQKAPYIMGIPEMVTAINKSGSETGKKIDLLVMDTCYFNSIEAIYELGRDEGHTVQYMITYIHGGPICGLPYSAIVKIINQKGQADDLSIIKEIINNLSYDLVAFEINRQKLLQIKQMLSEMAFNICFSSDCERNHSKTRMPDTSGFPPGILPEELSSAMLSMVVGFRKVQPNNLALVTVANKPTSELDLLKRYHKLSFAQNNYWTYLLSNRTFEINKAIDTKNTLRPLKLKPQEVYGYISIVNPGLDEEQRKKMLEELFASRNWIKKGRSSEQGAHKRRKKQ